MMTRSISRFGGWVVGGLLYWNRTLSGRAPRPYPPSAGRFRPARIFEFCAGDQQGGDYVDSLGRLASGPLFQWGRTFRDAHHKVSGTRRSDKYHIPAEGDFALRYSLKPGVYELRPAFCRDVFGESNIAGGGDRAGSLIVANGDPLVPELDVIGVTGRECRR